MIRRVVALMRNPDAAWRAIAAADESAARVALFFVLPMSLVPAVAWMTGVALFPGDIGGATAPSGPGAVARAGIGTFVGSILSVLLMAVAIAAPAPLYGVRRDWEASFRVAAYGTTPVWLAGALLVKPALILLVLVGVMHACYLYSVGLQRVLDVRSDDAAEYVAISAVLTIAMSMLAGGALGSLGLL